MDNEPRGEVSLKLDGKARTLVFDWDALARLKTELGSDFDVKIGQAGYDFDLDVLALALAIGLRRHWPEVTPEMVKVAGPSLVEVIDKLRQALNLAFYGSKEAPISTVNPPNRQARRASSSKKAKKRPTARA